MDEGEEDTEEHRGRRKKQGGKGKVGEGEMCVVGQKGEWVWKVK